MSGLNLVHLNGLRALEAVGRLGSLQAAAAELGVTVGAVSQQILKAEAQLGRPVFQRLPKGMVAAEWAVPVLAKLTDGFQSLSQAVCAARRRDDTLLTISVPPVFAARFLVHRLDRFSRRYPDIRLRIDATTSLVDFDTENVDLAVRVGRGHWPGVDAELMLRHAIFPVCAPAWAERLRKLEDIFHVPVIIDTRAIFSEDAWLRAAGLDLAPLMIRHSLNEASLCLEAAIAGEGVMFSWQTLSAYATSEGKLVEPFSIRADIGIGYYFVTHSGSRLPPKVIAFREWLRDEFATLDADI
ncbi:LysR substrate-binding domain-containing protein [Segnochrobactrum spirostomi]|uniref:LysR family transcriptional regulator n=1 Tax=Segnochrobactrum spirostomi TaxID=2608987 RepID=A0A6A7Y6T5_9HYPH|nr:LysR substrate-binding domain-containing protein [Segnochrobactrum spirostomi]MQT15040.1 LysR family transcriptional regulator [Segnochrobactrum spirostomi]